MSDVSWSNEGDLLTLTHALSGTAYDVSFTDGYTPAHQIETSAVSNGLYQYVPQTTGTDAYAPNALNQYASVTPAGGALTAIGYDLNGNLTSDGTFAFAYDAENKLMTAAKTGTAVSYGYDGLGRRDEKIVNGTATYFLSADADEIAEYDGAGALLRRYVPGPAIDRPIAMVDAAGTKTFFHQDKTGSVIAMSDTAGSLTEGPYLYDACGNGAPYTGVPFKYTGRRLDPETGLYYYRSRLFSSSLCRFLQTDSIGYTDGINWYTYVGNDPTDRTDPSGNFSTYCGTYGCSTHGTRQYPVERETPSRPGEMGSNGKRLANGGYDPTGSKKLRDGRPHKGIDLPAKAGAPVAAVADGTIIRADGKSTSFGDQVVIDHGNGDSSRVAHLSSVDVKAGQDVKRGDQVGEAGNTGNARDYGTHVHLESV